MVSRCFWSPFETFKVHFLVKLAADQAKQDLFPFWQVHAFGKFTVWHGTEGDQFIDYKTEDYTQILSQIDYVLDTLGGAETEKQMSIIKKVVTWSPSVPCQTVNLPNA